jgi:hypothetical protein
MYVTCIAQNECFSEAKVLQITKHCKLRKKKQLPISMCARQEMDKLVRLTSECEPENYTMFYTHVQLGSDNLLAKLPNTVHCRSLQGVACTRLTLEWPGSITPISKTSTVFGEHSLSVTVGTFEMDTKCLMVHAVLPILPPPHPITSTPGTFEMDTKCLMVHAVLPIQPPPHPITSTPIISK